MDQTPFKSNLEDTSDPDLLLCDRSAHGFAVHLARYNPNVAAPRREGVDEFPNRAIEMGPPFLHNNGFRRESNQGNGDGLE